MPDTIATIRDLQVRPSQVADLAFNMSGIIDRRNYDFAASSGPAHLGKQVARFDMVAGLYSHLGETLPPVTNPSDPGYPREANARLKYDSSAIAAALTTPVGSAPFLFALRNQALAASLDQMINQRENSYLERYKHASQIKQAMQAAIPQIVTHLQNVLAFDQTRFTEVDAAYLASEQASPPRPRVMTASITTTAVSPDYAIDTSNTTTNRRLATLTGPASLLNVDASNLADLDKFVKPTLDSTVNDETQQPNAPVVQSQHSSGTASLVFVARDNNTRYDYPTGDFDSQTQKGKSTTSGTQSATTPNQVFGHARLDNAIGHEQAQTALLGELMNQTIASLRVPYMDTILANELAAIDQQARKLQTNYAHTFLASPITGIITAVYKDLGDSVQAGEPVLRVENDDIVFVTGQVLYRGLLRIGQAVTIHIDDLFADGETLDVDGTVIAVRGHETDNDEYELVIECRNPLVAGAKAWPLYYQFDRDMAHIVVH